MKKNLKIIAYNIFFIFIVLLITEAICFINYSNFSKQTFYRNQNHVQELKNKTCPSIIEIFIDKYIDRIFFTKGDFRKPQGLEYAKNDKATSPIILLGCSFNYGYGLDENGTFQAFLAHQTKRPVYNLSLIGGGFREALYILRTPNARKMLLPNVQQAKYFIYTYIPSHRVRLYVNFRPHVPNFKYDKSYKKLIYYKDYLNNKTCLVPRTMNLYSSLVKNDENTFKLIKLYLISINNAIKKHYNNYDEETKLVFLMYDKFPEFNWEELEKEGIIVIELKKLVNENFNDKKFYISDEKHPSSKAWEVVTPALVKKLGL